MGKFRLVFSGIDDWTDVEYMRQLAPYAQFEFIVSVEERTRRFSHLGRAVYLAERMYAESAALRVCGERYRELLRLNDIRYLIELRFDTIVLGFPTSETELAELCERYRNATVVTRHEALDEALAPPLGANHARRLYCGTRVPEGRSLSGVYNVVPTFETLAALEAVLTPGAVLEFEDALRNPSDKFDIGLAYSAIKTVSEFEDRRTLSL